jgi:lipooligosaccharide transport system ATP-binding protein
MNPVHDGAAIRARIGVVPQEDNLDTELTVADNLLIYGRYFGLPVSVIRERVTELLAFARLDDRRDSRVDPLSGGMKRRLTIARALVNRPELLLLDEPTTGLDPQARHLLWERLYRLKREGVTQVLTTHYMEEAEQLCDRLVIMDGGRIVAEGSPRQLIERHSTREVVELRFAVPEQQDAALPLLAGVGDRVEPVADRVLIYTAHGDDTVAHISHQGIHPDSVLVRRGSLEDVFLLLTGRSLDE